MSLNLCFKTVCCNRFVDFPFQTSTKLTLKVMEEKDKEIQLALISHEVDKWDIDADYKQKIISDVKKMLNDNSVQLVLT